jgi:hypothetical protein
VECMKWSGSERVSRECSEDILMEVMNLIDVIDVMIDTGLQKSREREGRSDQLYSFPTGFGLRPSDH